MNVILNKLNFELISFKNIRKIITTVIGISICQILFLLSVSLNIEKKEIVIIMIVCTILEILYFLITIKVIKKLQEKENIINSMFYQSIFLNIGLIFTCISLPFFVISYFKYINLYEYYILSLSLIFLISILYTRKISIDNLSKSSYEYHFSKNQKHGSSIFFVPSTLPKLFQKFPLIAYIPYGIIIACAFYSFINRGDETALFYLTLSFMLLSSILLYSEICYFLLAIKYLLTKNKHKTKNKT